MKICLIGGSGFIGTRLMSELLPDHTLKNLDKRQSRVHPHITTLLDVRNPSSLNDSLDDTDLVILLAAEHRDDVAPVSLYYEVNVTGMKNTLKAMDRNGIQRIVFFSSVAVYGKSTDGGLDEESPTCPLSDYGKSKLQAEDLLRAWAAEAPGRRAIIIRPTVVFGESNRGNLYTLAKSIYRKHFIMVGNGRNVKSIAYVGNLAAFAAHLIRLDQAGINTYNYADKPDHPTKSLVNAISDILGVRRPKVTLPLPVALFLATAADICGSLLNRQFSVTANRVTKFCDSTAVASDKAFATKFVPPFTLKSALTQTLKYEFAARASR